MATTAIIGAPGMGKSFVLTTIARQKMARGRIVFTNWDVKGAVRFQLDDLYDLPPGVVMIDEAASWFHSRRWQNMGDGLLEKWNQTRKAGWDLYIATQHEGNLDTVIKRNVHYGVLLSARWKVLSMLDARSRAHARVKTAEAVERFRQYQADGVFPPDAKPPKVSPIEVGHPLYVRGQKWLWHDFRNTRKDHRPISVHRWWWSWDTALAYDTTEVLKIQSSKEIEHDRIPDYEFPSGGGTRPLVTVR